MPDAVAGKPPRVVIKIGTSSLIRAEAGCLNLAALAGTAEVVRSLRDAGVDVVLVSSGSVGAGCQRLGLAERPAEHAKRQALAAVGQGLLMRYWNDLGQAAGLTCAQVLLTLENLADPAQYSRAQGTFEALLAYGVVPVVNENDTVAVGREAGDRIGDNDTLSAQVATLIRAEWLFLLTDVDGLYTANPNLDATATRIEVVEDVGALRVTTDEGGAPGWGSGGMATKLSAAAMATATGTRMVICSADPENVARVVLGGERVGTLFLPAARPLEARGHRWIMAAPPRGQLTLGGAAARALAEAGPGAAPLRAGEVVGVEGEFEARDPISICDLAGRELGRGVAAGSAAELGALVDAALAGAAPGLVSPSKAAAAAASAAAELADAEVLVGAGDVCLLPCSGSAAPSVRCASPAGSDADAERADLDACFGADFGLALGFGSGGEEGGGGGSVSAATCGSEASMGRLPSAREPTLAVGELDELAPVGELGLDLERRRGGAPVGAA